MRVFVVGGEVYSGDGDVHFVDAPRLVILYGLYQFRKHLTLCRDYDDLKFKFLGFRGHYVVLTASSDGDYSLPEGLLDALRQEAKL